jgi:hypothetical protein
MVFESEDENLVIEEFYHKKSAGNGVLKILCMEVEAFGMFLGLLPTSDSYQSTLKGEKQCEK